jgi:hypothetical protein
MLNNTKESAMYRYKVWIRLNQYQTANVIVNADNDWQAKMIAESQYGQGMVLNYMRED